MSKKRQVTNRIAHIVVAAVTASAGLGACSAKNPLAPAATGLTCSAGAGAAVTLVIGARANTFAPAPVPDPISKLLNEAAKASAAVRVIRLDGRPAVTLEATFHSSSKNSDSLTHDLNLFLTRLEGEIASVRAKAPEADVLGALSLAAKVTPTGGTIVLIDSGLQTVEPLRYEDADMLTADPSSVTQYLRSTMQLPDLRGASVVLVGTGATASPQSPLPQSLVDNLVQTWRAIAKGAGASCVEDLQITSRAATSGVLPSVSIVESPSAPNVFGSCSNNNALLGPAEGFGFLPGTATLSDPAKTRDILSGIAPAIIEKRAKVHLVGMTDSEGAESANLQLSKARADAVKAILVALGVSADAIDATGVGSGGPFHIPDRDGHGVLIPTAAAHNRAVVLQVQCT